LSKISKQTISSNVTGTAPEKLRVPDDINHSRQLVAAKHHHGLMVLKYMCQNGLRFVGFFPPASKYPHENKPI